MAKSRIHAWGIAATVCAGLMMTGCGAIAQQRWEAEARSTREGTTTPARESLSAYEDVRDVMLVNAEHAVPEGDVALAEIDGLPLAYSGMKLRPDALDAAKALFATADERGYGGFVITSAYRTQDKQRTLYEEAEDKSYVALPGHSEHQTGLAIDVQRLDGSNMDTSLAGRWLTDHAHEFGYVQRYPADKVDITGISYEPWHFRYVGRAHATIMREKGLCLEEYIDWLAEHPQGAAVRVDDVRYRVVRVVPEDGTFASPGGRIEALSGDNTGGALLTMRQ